MGARYQCGLQPGLDAFIAARPAPPALLKTAVLTGLVNTSQAVTSTKAEAATSRSGQGTQAVASTKAEAATSRWGQVIVADEAQRVVEKCVALGALSADDVRARRRSMRCEPLSPHNVEGVAAGPYLVSWIPAGDVRSHVNVHPVPCMCMCTCICTRMHAGTCACLCEYVCACI